MNLRIVIRLLVASFLFVASSTIQNAAAANATLPLIGIRVNNGQAFTNSREIVVEIKSLKLDPKLLSEMQIGFQPDLSDGNWTSYTEGKQSLTLPGADGLKTIYVRLKDKAGNMSPIESAGIALDTAPPTNCSMTLNNGAAMTNDKQMRVMLNLSANDAVKMQISASSGFENAIWEPYADRKTWLLSPPGDGRKVVYARFMDAAQNMSEILEAAIILDATPPAKGEAVINENAKFTRSPLVKIKVTAEDANKVYLIDRNGKNQTIDLKEGKAEVEWNFDSLQGMKTIKAYFIDAAMNKSVNPAIDDIMLDSEGPPAPVVAINGGANYTNHPEGIVNLKLSSRANPSLIRMQICSTESFEGCQPTTFAASVDGWRLPSSEDGLKSVFVRFIDEAGNNSPTTRADIFLDRQSPVLKVLKINGGAEFCVRSKVNITIEHEGAAFMQLGASETIVKSAVWEKVRQEIGDFQLPVGDGGKIVYLRLKDEAENIAGPYQARIMLDTKPPVGEIVINDNGKFFNDPEKKADLHVRFDDAIEMQVSEIPDFSKTEWQPVKPLISDWSFSGDDGIKNVFLRLRDKAGNVSAPSTASVTLDRKAPEDCRLMINAGAKWINNPGKRVTLAFYAKGAFEMLVSHDPDFASVKWVPVRPTAGWTLEGDDGVKKVYARYRDEAGNESEVVSASTILDTKAPEGSFNVDKGSRFTNNKDLQTLLTAQSSSADFVAFSNKPFENPDRAEWKPFREENDWKLDDEDGPKTIFMILKDSANNISSPYTANIILDRTPPVGGRILINNNEKVVNHPQKLTTILIAASGATEMMVSNAPDFRDAAWEPFQPKRDKWELTGDDGEKTVFARFKDEAGNISEAASSRIRLDRTPPTDIKIAINGDSVYATRKDRIVNVRIHALEAKSMMLGQDKDFTGAQWEEFKIFKELMLHGHDGEKEVFLKCRDEAGNESEPVSASIILDITPPELIRLSIDNGAEWTNANDKKVQVTVEAKGADWMMIASEPAFQGCDWRQYQAESAFILPGDDGEKEVFVRLKDKAGNESPASTAKINLKRTF